jgi:hypothetical protein
MSSESGARAGLEEAGPALQKRRVVGRLERKGGKRVSNGRRAVLIPRESGGGPVHAPCPMRGSRLPNAGLPFSHLLILI